MKVQNLALVFCTTIIMNSLSVVISEMNTMFRWKYIDFVWPGWPGPAGVAYKNHMIMSRRYVPELVVPMDVDVSKNAHGLRVFIAMRGVDGVPATLGVVTDLVGPSGHLIAPYPDWSWFEPNSCHSLLNVYRIAIDKCNRLWVLDTGFVESLHQTMKCEAKLVYFDLNTDTLLGIITIPDYVAKNKEGISLLSTPIVETSGPKCEDTTVYMADSLGHGILVWRNGKLIHMENPLFVAPKHEFVATGSHKMFLKSGIVGMDVSPQIFPDEPRYLYFRPLSSRDLFNFDTRHALPGRTLPISGARNILSSQSVAHAFSSEGTLFFGMTHEYGISCWNRYRELMPENFALIAQNYLQLEYPNGVKVIPAEHTIWNVEELWVLSNRLIRVFTERLDINEFNFHILMAPVSSLVEGTVCEMPLHLKRQLYPGSHHGRR